MVSWGQGFLSPKRQKPQCLSEYHVQAAVLHSLGLSAMAASLLEALQDPSAHVSNADALHARLLLIDIHLSISRLDNAAGAHASSVYMLLHSPVRCT